MSRQNRKQTGNGRKRLAAAVLAAAIALSAAVIALSAAAPVFADEGAQPEKGPGITTAAETEAQPNISPNIIRSMNILAWIFRQSAWMWQGSGMGDDIGS